MSLWDSIVRDVDRVGSHELNAFNQVANGFGGVLSNGFATLGDFATFHPPQMTPAYTDAQGNFHQAQGSDWDNLLSSWGKMMNGVTQFDPTGAFKAFAQGQQWAYSNIVSHPLTTAYEAATLAQNAAWQKGVDLTDTQRSELQKSAYSEASGNVRGHGLFGANNWFTSFFDPGTWHAAWDISQHKSPGQALIDSVHDEITGEAGRVSDNTNAGTKQIMDLLTSPQVKAAQEANDPNAADDYRRSWWYSLTSGSVDAFLNFRLDPMVAVTKAIRPTLSTTTAAAKTIAKAGGPEYFDEAGKPLFKEEEPPGGVPEDYSKPPGRYLGTETTPPAEGPAGAIQRVVWDSGTNKFLNWVESQKDKYGRNAWQTVAQHPVLKVSPVGAEVANLLTNVNHRGEMEDVMRVFYGDSGVANELAAQRPALLAKVKQIEGVQDAAARAYAIKSGGQPVNPAYAALFQDRMAVLNDHIDAINKESGIIDRLIGDAPDDTPKIPDSTDPAAANAAGEAAAQAGDVSHNPGIFAAGVNKAGRVAKDGIQGTLANKSAEWSGLIQSMSQKGLPYLPQSTVMRDGFSSPIHILGVGLGKASHFFRDAKLDGHLDTTDPLSYKDLDLKLREVPGLDPQTRLSLVNDYMQETTPAGRQAAADNADKAAIQHIFDSNGIDEKAAPGVAQEFIARHLSMRNALYSAVRNRAFSGTIDPTTNDRVDMVHETDAGAVMHPLLRTQLAKSAVLTDYAALNKAVFRAKHPLLAASAFKGLDAGVDLADLMMRVWKTSVLMRLGFIPHVVGDDYMATLAQMGSLSGMRIARAGAQNFIDNSKWRMKSAVDQFRSMSDLMTQANDESFWNLQMHNLGDLDFFVNRKLPSLGVPTRDQYLSARDIVKANAATQAKASKTDLLSTPATFTGLNGQLLQFAGYSPANQRGDYWRTRLSGDGRLARELDNNYQKGQMRRSAAYSLVHRGDADYYTAWSDALNKQFLNDPLARILLASYSDRQGISEALAWLKTGKGRAYAKSVPFWASDPEDWVNRINIMLQDYAPRAAGDLRERLLQGKIANGGVLKRNYDAYGPLQVHGEYVAHNLGSSSSSTIRAMQAFRDGWFKYAAQMPTDVLVKHPLAAEMYKRHLGEQVDRISANGEPITSDTMAKMEDQARRFALNEVTKTVMDLQRYSHAAHAMRFISPFYGATDVAMRRWANLAWNNPYLLFRGNQVWQSVGQMPIFLSDLAGGQTSTIGYDANGHPVLRQAGVYDQNGNLQTGVNDIANQGDRYLTFRMPKIFAKAFGASDFNEVSIPEASVNVVLQGNPWWFPGLGPISTIPLSAVTKNRPDVQQSLNTLLPFGAQGVTDAFMPGSIRKYMYTQDPNSAQYANLRIQGFQIDWAKYLEAGGPKSGRPAPNPADPKYGRQANHILTLDALLGVGAPVSAKLQTPFKYYMDEYHKLVQSPPIDQNQPYKLDASGRPTGQPNYVDPKTAFLQKYPSFWMFAESLSKNNTTIPATDSAFTATKRYADLLAKAPLAAGVLMAPFGNAVSWDPKRQAWVADKNANQFDINVYDSQFNMNAPGSSAMMRQHQTPEEFAKAAEVDNGWRQYKAFNDELRNELANRGLSSFQQNGAQDLDYYRKQFIYNLGQQYPAWMQAYNSVGNSGYTEALIGDLRTMLKDPRVQQGTRGAYGDRSDLKTLAQYISTRDAVMDQLKARQAQGGSANLQSQSNADLLQWWMTQRDTLAQSNAQFSDWVFDQYLANDVYLNPATPPTPVPGVNSNVIPAVI